MPTREIAELFAVSPAWARGFKQRRRETGEAAPRPMGGATVIKIEVFTAFVERVLLPELRPGDVVILDNLSSHKGERAKRLVESRGARLVFLPPYSPDLNPIEMVFSKIKTLLRSLACRTREALWRAMQSVLDRVTPSDAANCFRHCGYTPDLD